MKHWRSILRSKLTLAQQYALASLAVLVAGMLAIGWWVSQQIQHGVIQNTAVTSALYVNSFVAPEIQDLASLDYLSKPTMDTLQRLLSDTPLGQRIPSFKLWGRDGRVIYSSRSTLIGQSFPVTPLLARAWQGEVTAEFSDFDDEEDAQERQFATPLLEIYSPVREHGSDRIIAVAEFYKDAAELEAHSFTAQIESWLMTAGVTLAMLILLFGIVYRGSRTIEQQQSELHLRIQELSRLLSQNKELHERVQRSSVRAVEINEHFLRRISAELHDGPAQAIGFALLRLDAIGKFLNDCQNFRDQGECQEPDAMAMQDLGKIRQALREALAEIRDVSSGLALPQLDKLTVLEVLQRVTRAHMHRTGTVVDLRADEIADQLPLSYKIGIYRFVQEALNNAFKHAGGLRQQVHALHDKTHLRIEISDAGPGFKVPDSTAEREGRLGLAGMRERIESLGGTFALDSLPNQGTRVQATLPVGPPLELGHA